MMFNQIYLSNISVTALRRIAKSMSIKGYSVMTQTDLITEILLHQITNQTKTKLVRRSSGECIVTHEDGTEAYFIGFLSMWEYLNKLLK